MDTKTKLFLLLTIALLVRLPNIVSPLIGVHSWRQADTASMARNYIELDGSFGSPRVDYGGGAIIESEFPIYQYFISILYRLFGIHDIFGRIVSIIASLTMLLFFFYLIKKITDETTAWWSTIVLGFLPTSVFYSRTFMPDSLMLMFTVIGLYYFVCWLENQNKHYIIFSAISIALACLVKITSLYIGFILLFLSWQYYRWKLFKNPSLLIYAVFVLGSVAAWYYHAHQNYLNGGVTVGIWEYGSDKWGNWYMLISFNFWEQLLFNRIATLHLTYIGFIVFTIGLFLKRANSNERLFDFWIISVFIYFLIVAKGNFVHDYYQLPLLPPAAFFIGKVFSRYLQIPLFPKVKTILVSIALVGTIILSSIILIDYYSAEDPRLSYDWNLAQVINSSTSKDEMICLHSQSDPTIFYLSHRRGYLVYSDLNLSDRLNELKKKKCTVFAGYYYAEPQYQPLLIEEIRKRIPIFVNNEVFLVRL